MADLIQDGELATLGQFVFQAVTAAPTRMSYRSGSRWASVSRQGLSPVKQWVGKGDKFLTLTGVIYTEFSLSGDEAVGFNQLDALEEMKDSGEAWSFCDGVGNCYGKWIIKDIIDDRSVFHRNGYPRKQDFTIELEKYHEGVDKVKRGIKYREDLFSSGKRLLSGASTVKFNTVQDGRSPIRKAVGNATVLVGVDNFRSGLNKVRTKSWTNITMEAMMNAVFAPHGYGVKIDSIFNAVKFASRVQDGVTDIDFMDLAAQELDAVLKLENDNISLLPNVVNGI